MTEIGLGDDLLGLDRVHEALDGLGQRFGDQAHLADRSHVIVRDSGVPQDLEEVGRRVRLDRIERAARKLLDEETGGTTRGVRTQQRDRLNRTQLDDVSGRTAAGRKGR